MQHHNQISSNLFKRQIKNPKLTAIASIKTLKSAFILDNKSTNKSITINQSSNEINTVSNQYLYRWDGSATNNRYQHQTLSFGFNWSLQSVDQSTNQSKSKSNQRSININLYRRGTSEISKREQISKTTSTIKSIIHSFKIIP